LQSSLRQPRLHGSEAARSSAQLRCEALDDPRKRSLGYAGRKSCVGPACTRMSEGFGQVTKTATA